MSEIGLNFGAPGSVRMTRYLFRLSTDLIDSQKTIYVWHIADYHLFIVRSSIEFISVRINLHHWMYNYQTIVYEIMKKLLPIDMPHPQISPRKRPHDEGDGKGRKSKHRADKDSDPSSGQSGGLGSKDTDMGPPASGESTSFNISITTFTE
jgi:hypothetical protein